MSNFDLTPEQDQKIAQELMEAEARQRRYRATMTPQMAQTTGQLYRNHPYAPPGLIMSSAGAVASGMMTVDQANNLVLQASKNALTQSVQQPKKEKKGWFERNILSKARTASRWAFAGLNFIPEVATNIASQLFNDNPSAEGFFISTDLGTLIKNDEVAGDGWFMGSRALELQAERARRYRGEIGGHAWTFGRGFASLVAQPNSKPYNILSGLVDAAAQIAIPAVPGPALRGARMLTSEIKDVAGLRTLAGLTNFENGQIIASKVAPFLDSKTGQTLINKISNIKTMDEALTTFKDVQHMDFINEIIKLENPADIRNYLIKTLGRPIVTEGGIASYGVSNVDQINISRLDDMKKLVGRSSMISRLMSDVPGRHLVLSGGNPRDVAQSVRNLNNYLKILRVDPTRANELVSKFSTALVENDGQIYNVMEQFDEIFQESMRQMGAPDEAIKVFRDGMKDFQKSKDVYGFPMEVGADLITTNAQVQRMPFGVPGTDSEMLNQLAMILPDPQRVRRAMSQIGWIFGKGDKLSNPEDWRKLRMPLSALHGFQTDIWKPVTLMTGGYVLRNMTESAFRYTMTPGLKGGVLHPIQWMQIATMKKFRGTITGMKWADMTENVAERVAKEGVDAFDEAIGQGLRELLSEKTVQERAFKNRTWAMVKRTGGTRYRKGIQDNIALLHDDYVATRLAENVSVEEIVDELTAKIQDKYVRRLQSRWSNKESMNLSTGEMDIVTPEFLDSAGKVTPAGKTNLETYVRDYIDKRINLVTGGDPVLKSAIARGDGKFTDIDGRTYDIFKFGADKSGRVRIARLKKNAEKVSERLASETDPQIRKQLTEELQLIDKNISGVGTGFRNGYSEEWTNAVQRIIDEDNARIARGETPILLDEYKYAIDNEVATPIERGELANWKRSWNKTTDWMFGSLYPKRSSFLMQSPVFRQYYWEEIRNFVDELDTGSLADVRTLLRKTAETEGKVLDAAWLTKYTGSKKTAERLLAKFDNPGAAGKLSLEELDAYAKGVSLDRTKNVFYNASEKSNFADIMQIIVPFGTAWAESMKAMTRIAMSNPNAARRVGLAVQGFKNADPDGDGKGFFWKDPTTGEYVFNYPFSDTIGGLAAALIPTAAAAGGILGGAPGILAGAAVGGAAGFAAQEALGLETTRVIAPVKSISMALNILPGAGPFVQIGANRILSNFPKLDDVRDAILPYGEPDITTVGPVPVPSWARKVIDGIIANPDSSRLLGDLTIDVMRVLQNTGQYDLSKEEEKLRLENDAIKRARTLLVFRGLGQFIGPTRPDVDFEVATKEGDKYTLELSKAFRQMQQENYDTAVERFISTFGEDAFLYVEGKTVAVNGGLDASTRFGRFERNNGDLFAMFPNVAGYFADVGTNFDYAVYTRQIEKGQREKTKPSDFIELAQQTVGRALYKASQRAIGPNPDDYQKEVLRNIKALIQKEFPGYANIVVDINKQKAKIDELIRASTNPILDNNPIAEALRVYLKYRDEGLIELANRGIVSGDLTVKTAADIRARLRAVSDVLVDRYPEFERLFDRVLYSEIEGM